MGIRLIDLRIKDTSKRPRPVCSYLAKEGAFFRQHDPPPPKYWVSHTFLCRPLEEIIREIAEFVVHDRDAQTEVVVVVMKGDFPEKLCDDQWGEVRALWEAHCNDMIADCHHLTWPIGRLADAGKRLVLLGQGATCLPAQEDLVRGSWGKTRTADPNQLMDNMTKWLEDKQRHISGRNKKLHVLQAELTPDARMVISSILRLNCRGGHGTFSTNEAAACAAHKVLLQALASDVWRCLKVNVITHDFVRADIIRAIVRRNFSDPSCSVSPEVVGG
ncbi:unnamed protein product [Vitrella brassicaformis CCMP3155]|uniref:Uncharacterized protein n=1 Tax=Vitrella brassicaformis (strain CCMP3155) TaxID=1169540 RepID=A0A0G4FKV3_VITBC|nr:unnamed protein product [Vitrella brassicaformis CCMP3155]|mmetsp:Transcript_45462/g.128291  ORF Transcript_45462/g.128291 Transcript_45462/m.128291 type:complete len:274 (-) Transcript_45462:1343-2164(-)|eukprot:CEM14590.1 unnamed protein product [Vitrella brassicaformis CCMP3155]